MTTTSAKSNKRKPVASRLKGLFRHVTGRRDNKIVPYKEFASMRQFCFAAFDKGDRPTKVVKENPDLKLATVLQYHTAWKKTDRLKDKYGYKTLSHSIKHSPEFRESYTQVLVDKYEISHEEAEELLLRPYALQQIVRGTYRKQLLVKRELSRMDLMLALATTLIANLEDKWGFSDEDIDKSVKRFRDIVREENRKARDERIKNSGGEGHISSENVHTTISQAHRRSGPVFPNRR